MSVKSILSTAWNAVTRFSTKMEIVSLEADRNLAKSGYMFTGVQGPGVSSATTRISDEAAAAIIKTSEERIAELQKKLVSAPKPHV